MFFFLSKTLAVGISPLTWALALLVIGLLARRRRPRLAVAALILALVDLLVFSSDVVTNQLWRSLETPSSSTARSDGRWDAVIVLSGLVDDAATEAFDQPAYNEAVERLLTAYQLLRTGRARFVLLSGGSGRLRGGPPEAEVLARQLEEWGIESARIVIERSSRSTHENAVESTAIARREGWRSILLVTSAAHMPRALGCFRKLGLPVDTMAVDFRSNHRRGDLFPDASALAGSAQAIHEAVGRIVYRLVGYSTKVP